MGILVAMLRKSLVGVCCIALLAACGDDSTSQAADAGQSAGDSGPRADALMIDGWEGLPAVLGGPIQETGVAELNGIIYVIGGFNGQIGIVDSVRAYDVASRTWSNAAPVPRSMHHANVASVNGKLYVLGSLLGGTFAQNGESWEYDPATDQWTELLPMADSAARGSAAMGVIDGKIYLAGGFRNGMSVALMSAYDPATNTWDDTLAPMPEARDHLVGAAVGGTFYAIGGRNGGITALRSQVDAYDPVTDQWTSRAPVRDHGARWHGGWRGQRQHHRGRWRGQLR